MIMKLDAIKKRVEANKRRSDEIGQQIRESEEALVILNQELEAAAVAQDFDLYNAKEEQIRKMKNRIAVLLKAGSDIITPEEARDAWNEYSGKYNKAFLAAYGEYVAHIKTLCGEYQDLVKMQNDALKIREDLAGMVDEDPKEYELEVLPYANNKPLPRVPMINLPEMVFFTATGNWNTAPGGYLGYHWPSAETCSAVIGNKVSVPEVLF